MKIFHHDSSFPLELSGELPSLEIAYHCLGDLSNPIIWICHALTANSNPEEWWPGLVGAGKIFDPEKYCIVCANMLGSCYGTTSPHSIDPDTQKPYGKNFPKITIRDMVRAHQLLQHELGITKIHVCAGGSMGGQQALEWAISDPDLIERMFLIGTNARHSPWGIAFNETQRMALSLEAIWEEDHPGVSLEVARAIAMLSYRSYEAYNRTQLDANDKIDDFRASSYQRYQGLKLRRRFSSQSYWYLSKAMDTHNVGRDRGSIEEALGQIKAKVQICGIATDFLFPISEQAFLAKHIPNSLFTVIDSDFGHDGFLVEANEITNLLESFLS